MEQYTVHNYYPVLNIYIQVFASLWDRAMMDFPVVVMVTSVLDRR